MKTSRSILVCLAVILCAVDCGGGGGGGPTNPGGGGGGGGSSTFTATIDGAAWKSDAALIQVTGASNAARQGELVISGYNATTKRGITLNISFFVGPATQPLGVNPISNPGGTGTVIVTPNLWMTPMSGQAGFITITTRTDKRIAGTFHFNSDALVGGTVPAARSVTNGAFDITVAAGLPALPTGVGSTSTANLGGTPWNAATIVGLYPGAGVFGVTASSTDYTLTVTPVVLMSAGTWNIPSQVTLQINETGGTNAWAAVSGPDVGTMTITQFDAHRLYATYSANVPKLGGGTSLNVTSGTINAYLQ